MAISSKTGIENEYITKRDQILAYPAASLDDDLSKLETLSARLRECALVLAAREAVNGRHESDSVRLLKDLALGLDAVPGLVRGYISQAKSALEAVDASGPEV